MGHAMKAWLVLVALAGCAKPSVPDAGPAHLGTPVKTAAVVRANLDVTVRGPGRTDALEQQKVRAPFKGMLRELRVADGDLVTDHQIVAVLVSQESESALNGARALLQIAQTPQQRADAERALALAKRGLVTTALRAPEAGVVIAHGADEGSLVAEAQEIVSLAATDSFVFQAEIAQTELSRIKAGQPVRVDLSSSPAALQGTVHSVLPTASPAGLTARVRIDLPGAPPTLGLFGTAIITVDRRALVIAVPQAAVLRDDVSGITRVALAERGKAHWVEVKTGAIESQRVEIVSPALTEGAQVITEGQVGLPEGAPLDTASDGGAP
jgi:multidrug efflux pump subunit AcrA (membrane-fusion protein)